MSMAFIQVPSARTHFQTLNWYEQYETNSRAFARICCAYCFRSCARFFFGFTPISTILLQMLIYSMIGLFVGWYFLRAGVSYLSSTCLLKFLPVLIAMGTTKQCKNIGSLRSTICLIKDMPVQDICKTKIPARLLITCFFGCTPVHRQLPIRSKIGRLILQGVLEYPN